MPLFNEAAVIATVIDNALSVFPHIVCVDDGSSDDSAARARAAGAVLVRHPINLGQGAALQTGIDYAVAQPSCDYVVTFDADGQHLVTDAQAMVARLVSEPLDVVLGSRFLDDRTQIGWLKRLVLRTAVLFQRASAGIELTDAHNGLRAFTRAAAASIEISQNRMAHASQIVSEIAKKKLRYAEQPVHVVYTDYSRAKGQSLWNSINILVDLFLN
ncbi:MAG: glycosyltransferase family 2 protein [Microbacteriaceae bacterium]|nr:glycosyltransferase family 2 protein [Microbacteriaceae bacterium]MCL2794563.1 glycosyltransferase family 2 protein [Microbacteriaceae bacterium]